jgi:hypothetical protein
MIDFCGKALTVKLQANGNQICGTFLGTIAEAHTGGGKVVGLDSTQKIPVL